MYAFLEGTLEEKDIETAIINVAGVGYEIGISSNTFDNLPEIGANVRLYTYLQIMEREGTMQLYGFINKEEKELFLSLITVSGVGPKMAMTILSNINARDLSIALYNKDVTTLSKVKGLGKKTAERIILELSGKETVNLFNFENFTNAHNMVHTSASEEAISALVDMGLNKYEATNIVQRVMEKGDTTEQIIAKALRNMG